MKKFLVAVLFTFAFFGFNAKVQAEKLFDAEVKTLSDQIFINWEDIGDTYQVFYNDERIWQGSKSEFTHEGLNSNYQYNYKIIALDNKEKIDAVKVKTKTLPNKENSYAISRALITEKLGESKKSKAFIDAQVTSDVVKLNLRGNVVDNLDGNLELFKNGNLISSNEDGVFVDKEVKPGETNTYKFVAKRKVSKEKIEEINNKLEKENIKLSEKEKKAVYYKPYEYIKIVKVPEESQLFNLSSLPSVDPYDNAIRFRYRTFIAQDKAPAKSLIKGYTEGYQFGGDGRSFCYSCGTHRTQVDMQVVFDSNSSSSNYDADISASTLYDENGNFISSNEPTDASVTINRGHQRSDLNFFQIDHSVQVAYTSVFNWATPNIDYSFGISSYPNKSFSVSGTRDQAPYHEMYASIPYSDALVPIFREPNVTFEHLIPVLPNASINASF